MSEIHPGGDSLSSAIFAGFSDEILLFYTRTM